MRRQDLYAAVSVNGKVEVHATGLWGYATLCGLDANDSAISHAPANVPDGARIDCKRCAAIFRECSILRVSDFARDAGANVNVRSSTKVKHG